MKPLLFTVQVTLYIFVLLMLSNESAAGIQCYQCHGSSGPDYRPVDAAYRNISTGGFQGNHRTHMGSGATALSCNACHVNISRTSSHRSGQIEMSTNINSSPATGTYSKGAFFNQTSSTTLGTCSNVNCHFESVTPSWGSAVFTSPNDCDKCHGAPPNGGSTGAAGSHAKHDTYYPGVTKCQKCHPNNTTFQHATSAANRNLNMSFAAAPNNGSGAYSGPLNDYLPSQTNVFGDCSATYCHGATMSPNGGTNTTPTWGVAADGQCGTCHGATAANTPTRGSHQTHVGNMEYTHAPGGLNDKIYGRAMACTVCHKTGSGKHVDGKADWSFNSISSPRLSGAKYRTLSSGSVSSVPSSSYGTCTNLYCHSIIQTATGGALTGAANEYKTVTWGNMDEGTCGSCHAVDLAHATWAGRGGAAEISSGSHTKHLQAIGATAGVGGTPGGPARCAVCHNYVGSDSLLGCATVCHNAQAAHVDYKVDVRYPPTLYGASAGYTGTPAPGDGYGGCTAVTCHSNGLASSPTYYTPTWGNTASGACGTCHGVTATAPPSSVLHVKHVGIANPYRFACADCHSGYVEVTADATIAPTSTTLTSHVNKSRDVSFDAMNPFGTYSSANLSCHNMYCHSTGNTTVASGDLPAVYGGRVYTRQTWSGTLSCNGCHGRSTSNGMPDYTDAGTAGSATANSHAKHVASSAIACVECHEKTTKTGTTIRSTFPGKHVNGTNHDVYFNLSGLSPSGTYDNTLKKCSATYCHGAAASLAWGGSTYCNSCHSAKSGTTGGGGINNWGAATPVSAHKLHVEEATLLPSKYTNYSVGNLSINSTTYRFGCASCHLPGTGKAVHVSGYASGAYHAQVFFGYTSPGKKPSYTYTGTAGTADNGFAWSNGNTVCNATYCHSNGAGGSGTAVTWATTTNSVTNTRCKQCHYYTTASGSAIATGDHTAHVTGTTYNYSCRKCHAATTTDGSSITDKTKHVNKQINVAFNNTTTAVNGTYNGLASPMAKNVGSAYGSCTNTYCHSKGTSTTPSEATPNIVATWGSTLDTTCTGCHGGDNSATRKMGTVGSLAHAKHIQTYGYGCVKCHETTVSANRIISSYANHVNRLVNIEFNNSTTAVSGTYNGSASPMSKLPGTTTGTCTNTYCHSKGTSITPSAAAPNIVPNWTSNLNATCSSCHGNNSTATYKMGTVGSASHLKHVQTYTSFTCDYCHASTVSDSRTVSTLANHVNRKVDVDFNTWVNTNATYGGSTLNSKLPGSAKATCANTYCHSNGTSVATSTIPANTTVAWDAAAGTVVCNSCHGNATYSADFRKGAPLYTTGTPKGNAHDRHIRTGSLSGVYMQCFNCHAATTQINTTIANTANHVNKAYNVASVYTGFSSSFRDGDDTMDFDKVTLTYSYNASGSSCSNVSCHPVGLDITTTPPTPKTRTTSSVKWNSAGVCIDCHNIDMQSTSTYHHAMRNYSAGYPLLSPYSSASTGVNVYSRRCTMCHVDHNIFSNDLNSSNSLGRAGNLRTDIAVTPTVSSGYSNKDYIKSGTGGICISCHNTAKAKDTTRRKNDYPANVTPTITQAQYSASGHQYDVSAKFMSDGSTLYGNCSKCHNASLNETSVFMNATSAYQFANHNSGVRRLQGTLGAAVGETAEEQICFRCHSETDDPDPGGGAPKKVANKDYYGAAPMSLASQDIFTANLDFRPASATSTTSKLFFKPTAAENPAENMPNQHNTGDTFADGTWIGRSMSPWETTTAYETKSQATNIAGTVYWRMGTFTSPAVNVTTTVPAGNWTINIYCRESSTSQNARIRYMVYKWNVGGADSIGTTIIAKGTAATELVTTAAPGGVRQIAVSVGATTLTAGEKIVVDLSLETAATDTTSYTGSFYFGSGAPSDLTLPGDVKWTYADPGAVGFGHDTQHYTGIHLPSTKNETLAYISQNRHIECVDCHNPHATRNGLHGDYGIATGGSGTGVGATLINTNKNWVVNQWVGDYVSLISATLGTTTPVATITANTSNTLTITPYSGTWVAPVANTSVYRIITNTNKVSRSQRGVPGASVSYSGAWTNGTYTLVNEATYEYEICFKCHAVTNATTNTLRYWNVTSASLGAARWTNIGLEFNPNNISYHPVVQPLPATGNRRLVSTALTGGWAPGEVMSCSDCHGRDTSTSATAQGPHGSTVKWLLTGKYQNWPYTLASYNGTSTGGTFLTGTSSATYPSSNFCFNCHTWAEGGNAHLKGSSNHAIPCVNCHIRVPHGGKVPRLLTGTNAPKRYKPDGNGGAFSGNYLTSAQLPATGFMLNTDVSCYTTPSCGTKHTDNSMNAYSW